MRQTRPKSKKEFDEQKEFFKMLHVPTMSYNLLFSLKQKPHVSYTKFNHKKTSHGD